MQATDLDQVTNEIAAISVAKDFSPQYALVQNPFKIAIERVVAAAYDIPIYTETYGFSGGMTVEGTTFYATEYDYGRQARGLGGRLWIMSDMEHIFSGHMEEIQKNPGGWLTFNFNTFCHSNDKTYEETITDFVEALGRCLHMRPAEITFKNVLGKYKLPEDIIIMGTVVETDHEDDDYEFAEEAPVVPSAVSRTLTFVPNPFKTSPAELATILYPLYIEDELLGFTVRGDFATLYQLRHSSTWRCTKPINHNLPSLYVNDHCLKGIWLPAGWGYFVIDGTPDAVPGVIKRISKLTAYTFPPMEWCPPLNGLYFPMNIEDYKADVTLE